MRKSKLQDLNPGCVGIFLKHPWRQLEQRLQTCRLTEGKEKGKQVGVR